MATSVTFYDTELERRLARDFDRLRARLFNLFEAMGLPPERTKAAKELVRSLTYDAQAALIESAREER